MQAKKILALTAVIALIVGALFLALRAHKRSSERKRLAGRASATRTRAQQGDIKAEKLLASMYFYGKGVPQDYAAAVQWYQKGADQGDAEAEYYLSFMYQEGKGVPLDNANFLLWCRRSADQGFAKAQFVLGNAHFDGKAVPQDYGEAVRWYRKAADQGDAQAQNTLGYMYYNGQGAQKDYAESAGWFRKAADQGEPYAEAALGYMYYYGQGVQRDNYEAVRWYRKAAAHGNLEAQRFIASHDAHRRGQSYWRYTYLSVLFLGGSLFAFDFLPPGRNIGNRRQLAMTISGIATLLYVGLSLYSIARYGALPSDYLIAFWWAKRLLAGISVVMLAVMLLTPKKQPINAER